MPTLAVVLGCSPSQAWSQESPRLAGPSQFTIYAKNHDSAQLKPGQNTPLDSLAASTNAASASWAKPSWEAETAEVKLRLAARDENSLAAFIQKEGAQEADTTLASARLSTEDAQVYMNRNPAVLKNPYNLANDRGESFFGGTAIQSASDYMDANYHPGGIARFFQETMVDNPFDKRIVSPLSPTEAGNPGDARTRKNDIHFGLRDLMSDNPMAFVTLSDKAEIDVTRKNPSFTLRNPISIDRGTELVTAVGVEYPDWNVSHWSAPTVGATLAYVHGHHSLNLTTSAGTSNFQLTEGPTETRYAERVMLYAACTF